MAHQFIRRKFGDRRRPLADSTKQTRLVAPASNTAPTGSIGDDRMYGPYGGRTGENDPRLRGEEFWRTVSTIYGSVSTVSTSFEWIMALVKGSVPSLTPAVLPGETEPSDEAKRIKGLMEDMLFQDPLTTWPEIVANIAMSRFVGFSISNFWFRQREDGLWTVDDVQPRPQRSITKFLPAPGTGGGLDKVRHRYPVYGADGNVMRIEHTDIDRYKFVYSVHRGISTRPEGVGLFRLCAPDALKLRGFEKMRTIGFSNAMISAIVLRSPKGLYYRLKAAYQKASDVTSEGALDEAWNNAVKPLEDLAENWNGLTDQVRLMLDSAPYQVQDAQAEGGSSTKFLNKMQYDIELLNAEISGFDHLQTTIDKIERKLAHIFGTGSLFIGEGNVGALATAGSKDAQLGRVVNSINDEIAAVFRRDLMCNLMLQNGWDLRLMPQLTIEAATDIDVQNVINYIQVLNQAGLLFGDDPILNDVRQALDVQPGPEDLVERSDMRSSDLLDRITQNPQPIRGNQP